MRGCTWQVGGSAADRSVTRFLGMYVSSFLGRFLGMYVRSFLGRFPVMYFDNFLGRQIDGSAGMRAPELFTHTQRKLSPHI